MSHPRKTPNPAMLQCFSSLMNYKYFSIISSNSSDVYNDFDNTTVVNKFHDENLEKELKKCVTKELEDNIFKGKWKIFSRKNKSFQL